MGAGSPHRQTQLKNFFRGLSLGLKAFLFLGSSGSMPRTNDGDGWTFHSREPATALSSPVPGV
jgi:hypothetical protein